MEDNIISKILSNLKRYLLIMLACVLGAITAPYTILFPFIFSVIYACTYIYGKANNHIFPQYFFICLAFIIANNSASGVQSVPAILKWGLIIIGVLLIFNFTKLLIKHTPLRSSDKIVHKTQPNYIKFVKENRSTIYKALVHSLILFIVSWVAYIVYDHRGYWMIISAAAVLIGNEYAKISVRGQRRIIGALISLIVLCGLIFFNANTIVLTIFAIVSTVCTTILMPKKYILGSACVSIQATVSNILISGDFGYEIVFQRVLWTIIGSILTLALCYIFDKLIPSLYENYTKEKLIVSYK